VFNEVNDKIPQLSQDIYPIYNSNFIYNKLTVKSTLFYIIKGIPKYIQISKGLHNITYHIYFNGIITNYLQKFGLIIGSFYCNNCIIYYCWIQKRNHFTSLCDTCGSWDDEWLNESEDEMKYRIQVVLSDSLTNLILLGLSRDLRSELFTTLGLNLNNTKKK